MPAAGGGASSEAEFLFEDVPQLATLQYIAHAMSCASLASLESILASHVEEGRFAPAPKEPRATPPKACRVKHGLVALAVPAARRALGMLPEPLACLALAKGVDRLQTRAQSCRAYRHKQQVFPSALVALLASLVHRELLSGAPARLVDVHPATWRAFQSNWQLWGVQLQASASTPHAGPCPLHPS